MKSKTQNSLAANIGRDLKAHEAQFVSIRELLAEITGGSDSTIAEGSRWLVQKITAEGAPTPVGRRPPAALFHPVPIEEIVRILEHIVVRGNVEISDDDGAGNFIDWYLTGWRRIEIEPFLRRQSIAQEAGNQSSDKCAAEFRGSHISDKLDLVNQAAKKFWANADRDDRGTHPSNRDVSQWLQEHEFSENLADRAASIIRPSWAQVGRKPEE